MPPCLPNPHMLWPQGSGGGRSEGQDIFLPGHLRRLHPQGPAALPPTWVLSLHTTLLLGFCPGSVPLPTGGNGKTTTLDSPSLRKPCALAPPPTKCLFEYTNCFLMGPWGINKPCLTTGLHAAVFHHQSRERPTLL